MERDQFDVLTRQLGGAGSRRQVLRALGSIILGSALGGGTARLGLAKGKRKKKKRGKKPDKKPRDQRPLPPLPPGCQNCGTCQMCQDGACVGDPDLWLSRCLDSPDDPGGQCHVCDVNGSGACIPLGNGNQCLDGDECSWCQNGQCVPKPDTDWEPCGNAPCHICYEGVCTPAGNQSVCTDEEGEGVCCEGTCHHPTCQPGERFFCDAGQCKCDTGYKRCPNGRCVPEDGCCFYTECASGACCQGTCCENHNYSCSRDGCCPLHFICDDGRCDPRCFHDTCDPPENCP